MKQQNPTQTPQKNDQTVEDPRFGQYTRSVKMINDYVKLYNGALQSAHGTKLGDGADNVNENPKLWTKKDLVNMASSSLGVRAFHQLYVISTNCMVLNDSRTALSDDAKLAKAALTEFLPQGMARFTYIKLIEEVNNETLAKQTELMNAKKFHSTPKKKTGAIDLNHLPELDMHGITLPGSDIPKFDHQKALADLGVTHTAIADVTSPQVRAADDFVKAANAAKASRAA